MILKLSIVVFLINLINFGLCYVAPYNHTKKIVDGWNLYLRGGISKIFYKCRGIFLTKELYLTDSACIHRILRFDKIDKAFISKAIDGSNNLNIDVNLVTQTYYNENLSDGYDESRRHIVILIVIGQVDLDFDEDFIELPKNISDVDFSSCFLRKHNRYIDYVSPCTVENDKDVVICNYSSHATSGTPVICNLKNDPDFPVLIGIWSQNKYVKTQTSKSLILENLTDLRTYIFKNRFGFLGY